MSSGVLTVRTCRHGDLRRRQLVVVGPVQGHRSTARFLAHVALPPLLPAARAVSLVHSCARPRRCDVVPPLLAMARSSTLRPAAFMAANPRSLPAGTSPTSLTVARASAPPTLLTTHLASLAPTPT